MRNVILLSLPDGKKLVYGSIQAMLTSPENPIQVSYRQFMNLQAKGWPVTHSDCMVERLPVITSTDAKK
jgi:hypothetical protein